jgi:hypothetical protein
VPQKELCSSAPLTLFKRASFHVRFVIRRISPFMAIHTLRRGHSRRRRARTVESYEIFGATAIRTPPKDAALSPGPLAEPTFRRILTPLLENSLCQVLKSQGHDVTIFDDATQTQQDRTISSLFEQMRPELDAIFTKSTTADIERVFLMKPGPYLRHSVAHGLLHDGDPYEADAIYGCWLIIRLCLIPLLPGRAELG